MTVSLLCATALTIKDTNMKNSHAALVALEKKIVLEMFSHHFFLNHLGSSSLFFNAI